jgi:hypothetical protein
MENWPAKQCTHSSALYALANLPTVHASHSCVAALRCEPGTHACVGLAVGACVGVSVGDGVGENVGGIVGAGVGIPMHAVAPCTPAVHVKASQSWQPWYAVLSWYLPDGQWKQLVADVHVM